MRGRGSIAAGTASIQTLEVDVKVVAQAKGEGAPKKPASIPRRLAALAFLLAVAVTAIVIVAAKPWESTADKPVVPLHASGAGVTPAVLAKRPDWVEEGSAAPDTQVKLSFSIPSSTAFDQLHELLLNVSTPGHPMRFKFLRPQKLHKLVANPAAQAQVRDWLVRSGAVVLNETLHGLHITAKAPIQAWERALNVEFGRFVKKVNTTTTTSTTRRQLGLQISRVIHRARGPAHVPSSIVGSLEGIFGLSHLPPRLFGTKGARKRQGPAGSATVASPAAAPPPSTPSGGAGRRLSAPWVDAEGCAFDPCESSSPPSPPPSGRRRELQTWTIGSGEADHICCSGDGGDGGRRLQSWTIGSGQVDCSGSGSGSGGGRRRLSYNYQVDPLVDSSGGGGVCANGTAVNSTTIGLLRSHYGIPPNAGGSDEIVQWIITPTNHPHSKADLATFHALYGIRPHNVTDGCERLNGGSCTDSDDGEGDSGRVEANLDVQYMSSAAPFAAVIDEHFVADSMSNDDNDEGESPEVWLQTAGNCVGGEEDAICYGHEPPAVLSISWGVPEEDLVMSQMLEFNKQAVMLGLLGTTIVAAAGDGGAAGVHPYDEDEDGDSEPTQSCGDTYQTLFPAASPFVTSVGATQGLEDGAPERASAASTGGGITTGGGFSMIRYPKKVNQHQTGDVKTYLNSATGKSALEGYFKSNGQNGYFEDGYSYDSSGAYITEGRMETHRGYPDLALAGSAVQMVNGGSVILVDGTSASAPVFAAMVAAVVAERKAEGLKLNANRQQADFASCGMYDDECYKDWNATQGYMLGWLNPTLYKHPSAFSDITEGSNIDGRGITCSTDPSWYENLDNDDTLSGPAGFGATTGWDPVSGLGSITYPSLLALFPANVTTDANALDMGEDYNYMDSDANEAEDMEVFSPPSPPGAYGSYGG